MQSFAFAACCLLHHMSHRFLQLCAMAQPPIRQVLLVLCSTLDPVLRLEQRGITPQGIALVSAILAYLLAKPGRPRQYACRVQRMQQKEVSMHAHLSMEGSFNLLSVLQACWPAQWTTTSWTSSSAWPTARCIQRCAPPAVCTGLAPGRRGPRQPRACMRQASASRTTPERPPNMAGQCAPGQEDCHGRLWHGVQGGAGRGRRPLRVAHGHREEGACRCTSSSSHIWRGRTVSGTGHVNVMRVKLCKCGIQPTGNQCECRGIVLPTGKTYRDQGRWAFG